MDTPKYGFCASFLGFPHDYLEKPLDPATVAKKRARGRCVMHSCRRKAETGKLKCHTCQSRLKRLRNPLDYAYRNLARSAKKRGIGFELTLQEFTDFCAEHGYLQKKGRHSGDMTIDRIKNHLPYRVGNIRPLPNGENVAKGNQERFTETPVEEI